MKIKQASILLEVILSIVILCVITINSMTIYKEFFEINHKQYQTELYKIELLNTKYFLEKNLNQKNDLLKLSFTNETLYFQNSLLLNNVTSYIQNSSENRSTLKLCLDNQICKEFIFIL